MPDPLSTLAGHVRMSWSPRNLYNLYRLSFGDARPQSLHQSLSFKQSRKTLYQQKWISKRLLRAYHGDHIQERRFRRRYLPDALPALQANTPANATGRRQAQIPLASLMWREVEARLDTMVFRACFAHSVYEARRLVTQGHVKLNGQVIRDPGILLTPGDLFTVDPKEMYLLRQSDKPFEHQTLASEKADESEDSTEAAAEAESESQPNEGETEAAASETTTEVATPSEQSGEAVEAEAASTEAAQAKGKSEKKTSRAKRPKAPEVVIPGRPFDLPDFAAPFIFIPAYLEVSFPTCSAIYVRHPTARPGYSEIPTPYEADGEVMRLGWEYYKSVGRRRKNLKDHGDPTAETATGPVFSKDGKRVWGADWPEAQLQKRKMRGVREGRGRWANRPL